MRKLTRLIT
jgi:hypothetical protein